ncbi:MAG: AAA family ATPase [Opitutaceae bacterium]|nr:AAA family ATPase [Opitutaceae bacterium]
MNPRAPLTFTGEPLTIVYGGTGAGKSSYVRILNNACGSKNRRKIFGNVFEATAPQSCKIGYTVDGAAKDLAWRPADGLQAELAALEIYDTECGHVYISAENEVTFEPALLAFFQRLVDACAAVDKLIEADLAALPSKQPVMPAEYTTTTGAAWYGRIGVLTSAIDVKTRCEWLPTHKEQLEGLQARVAAKNPAEQAKQLRTRKTALDKFSYELNALRDGLSDAAVSALLQSKADAAAKRKAASEDAEKVFTAAPLDGVGLASWKLLWEQARAYSVGVAYPEKPFPFVADESRCVLCQQTLGDDAKTRLQSFEKFVKGELELLAKDAETALAALVKKVPAVPAAEDFAARLTVLGLDDETVTQKLREFRDGADTTREALLTATAADQIAAVPAAELIADVAKLSGELEAKAKGFDDDANKTDKTGLEKQVRELEARKWLNEQMASIDGEIARLKKIAALNEASRLTNTTALSLKKSELAQSLVSAAFIQRFQDELKALGAARVRVELIQTRTSKGHVFHQVRLKNAKIPAATADVLSEGERRVVSLAAFLADVAGIDTDTPVVFDDPISSLDQDFEESVVARVITLAKKRQVIVFTHRLSMLTHLEDGAKAAALPARVVAVNREPWSAGEPGETPFITRKPDKVINGLLNDRLARARKILTENGRTEYDIFAKAICSDVRILVERLVEDALLNEVVRRFRRAVHTQNKIGQLAKIRVEDCQLIDEFMTKYSRYEHSQPTEAPVPLPEPDEIAADLTRLQTWLKQFTERPVPAAGAKA